jgi:spore germination protein
MVSSNVINLMKHTPGIITNLYISLILSGFFLVPAVAQGASQDIGVWIPWWAEEAGTESALENIRDIDIIYPFVFEVDNDGELKSRVDFSDDHWEDLFDEADDRNVDIIPTIAWFNGSAIHATLSDREARESHIKDIVRMVRKNGFDGVNIDYESKLGETIDYFSKFLEELEEELGRRDLTCTIEARTPPESLWKEVPKNIEYANDYKEMNKHCDWLEIMAYDQQRADLKLNQDRRGVPYMPVADTDWVEKVVKFALEDIDEDKIMLGVATYGRAWDVTVASEWYRDYTKVASLNHSRILELIDKYDLKVGRSDGGEAVISYFPEDSAWEIFNTLPTPKGTPRGYEAAAKALMVATYANIEVPVRFITWSDAEAVKEKLDLVNKYDLKGVAVFKVDGEEDRKIWRLF